MVGFSFAPIAAPGRTENKFAQVLEAKLVPLVARKRNCTSDCLQSPKFSQNVESFHGILGEKSVRFVPVSFF